MKRFYYLATALLLLAGAAGCKKNADVQEPETQPAGKMVPFTVSTGQSSQKTSVIGGVLSWSEGDQITVVQQDGQYPTEPLTLTAGASTAEGSFSGEISADVQDGAKLYGLYGVTFSEGTYTTSIPTTQAWTSGSFLPGAFPSVGTGTYSKEGDTNINFSTHPMGILRLNVSNGGVSPEIEEFQLTSVILESQTTNIAGSFTLTPSSWTVSEGSSKSVSMSFTAEQGSLSENSVQCNFVIAPGNYAPGDLKVTMSMTDGTSSTYYLGAEPEEEGVSVSSGSVTSIDIHPTKGKAEITGGGYVEWVQLVPNGESSFRWAIKNIGATSVGDHGEYYSWGGSTDKCYTDYFTGEGKSIIGTEDDTAKKKWGANWQMVSADYYKYHWRGEQSWKSAEESGYGVAGILIQGAGACQDNSVFIPASGYYNRYDGLRVPKSSYIWSGQRKNATSTYPTGMSASASLPGLMISETSFQIGYCLPVRPVLKQQ